MMIMPAWGSVRGRLRLEVFGGNGEAAAYLDNEEDEWVLGVIVHWIDSIEHTCLGRDYMG